MPLSPRVRSTKWTRLAAAALALALVAGACGDDDTAVDDENQVDPPVTAPDTIVQADELNDATEPAGGEPTDTVSVDTTGDADETAGGTFEFLPLDAGSSVTKAALESGQADVALLFSSDADIAVNDWVQLDDDRDLQQIENLTPAIRTDVVTPEIEAVLNAVSDQLTTDELTELNRQVTQDLQEPGDVAEAWLTDNGIIPWEGDAVSGSITVGSTNFFEQEIVAELYAQTLESAGADIERRFQLGARDVVAPALESGEIDLYPEYLGTYLVFADEGAEVPSDPAEAAEQLRGVLEPSGVTVLEPAEAENRNVFVVTQETADEYGLSAVSDLATVSDTLVLGGPPECPERPFCQIGLEEVYGLTFE